eukprot:c39133_g1_i1.p2 GENE.c39133_g1_i1~~c39133_g1_i1.p2  ORF type:complete len:789 (+),score=176.57 c39133_g1_i1:334-2367(+)
MFVFVIGMALTILLSLGLVAKHQWDVAIFTTISFVTGAFTSVLSGFIGMRIAVYANGRVAVSAMGPQVPATEIDPAYKRAFTVAFKAGAVMGFGLCSLAVIVCFILISLFYLKWSWMSKSNDDITNYEACKHLYESLAGYGLGGSSIALFGRVGGGIYTKAADVGADLVGKVEQGIPEDDPRNPAVIADNVGDNVGDVAGMGADLFGSFAESTCAALVVASTSSYNLSLHWSSMNFPVVMSAVGIVVCFITTFAATTLRPVAKKTDVEKVLKEQILISTVLMTAALYAVCHFWLPSEFWIPFNAAGTVGQNIRNFHIFLCGSMGIWSGLIIGYITEYWTSHTYQPVRNLSRTCAETGHATNIILGLALGYRSVIVPALCIAATIYGALALAWMFGIAVAALGILSTLAVGLTIDGYGPISDNAGGIAEMCELGDITRSRTDSLDAAGNTTAAIGKGFAIGSAAFVSLALFGAFVTRAGVQSIDIMKARPFSGLLVGAMLPYWFSAMTMGSVGKAADQMVAEVKRQFREIPGLMEGSALPDYERCVRISTEASLKEMLGPAVLVMGTPLVIGTIFGTQALAGLLAGSLVSSVQMAISCSNTGGAWDNCKKYIEEGNYGGKGSRAHEAAVVGDTVGDPLKDTSGPALNILMKLMAVESLVFTSFFLGIKGGQGAVAYMG